MSVLSMIIRISAWNFGHTWRTAQRIFSWKAVHWRRRGYQGFDYDRGEEYGELVFVVRSDARGKVDDVHIATES